MTDFLNMPAIVGGVCGSMATLIFLLFRGRNPGIKVCPCCNANLPAFRMPTTFRQAMWGGWTCPHCHNELDRQGKAIVT